MGSTKYDSLDLNTWPLAMAPYHFFSAGAQTTGTKKSAAIVGVAGNISDVRAYLDTAPTGSTFIVDVNKNGTTIFTSQAARPTIAISGNASTTTAPAVTAVAAGDRLSYDVDQIGASVAGSDLYLTVTVASDIAAAA